MKRTFALAAFVMFVLVASSPAFAQLVAAAFGHEPAQLRAATSSTSDMRRPRNCALDITLAQQVLQTRLHGVREVLSQQ